MMVWFKYDMKAYQESEEYKIAKGKLYGEVPSVAQVRAELKPGEDLMQIYTVEGK